MNGALGIVTFSVMALLIFGALATFSSPTKRNTADKWQAAKFDLSRARAAHVARTGCSVVEAMSLEREFKRWFVVAAASQVMIGMSSKPVDEFWHTLLEVDGGELYRAFSEAVAGRQVKHVEGVGSEDLDARAWVAYGAVWGASPAAAYFSQPSDAALKRYQDKTSSSSSDDGGITVSFGDTCSSHGGDCGDGGSHGGDGGGSDGGGGSCGSCGGA